MSHFSFWYDTDWQISEFEQLYNTPAIDTADFAVEKARIVLELKTFIRVMTDALIDFYSLRKDLTCKENREAFELFVLNHLLSGPVYIFMFNILSLARLEDIMMLRIVLDHVDASLPNLNVKEVFQLDLKALLLSQGKDIKEKKTKAKLDAHVPY